MWWLRRIFGAAAGAIALVVVLAGGLFGLAQTDTGRDWIARTLAGLASQPGSVLRIERIDGLIPFSMELRGLSVADDAGPWLAIDRLKVDWMASDILSRRLRLGVMEAGLIRLDRLPATAPAEPSPAATGPPGLPQLPFTVSLDRLAIERLEIAAAVAGEAVTLAVDGQAELSSNRAEASISVRRIDGEEGSIDLALTFAPDENRLEAKFDASEPSGRLADRLLGRTDRRPLRLTLDGAGPLDSWQGRLAGGLGDGVGLDLALTIAGLDPYRIQAAGEVRMAPILPPQWQELAAGGLRVSASVAAAGGATIVDSLHAAIGDLALSARGRIEADGRIAARLDGTLIDLAPIGGAVGQTLAGAVTVVAEVAGTSDAPELVLSVEGTGVAAATAAADGLSVRANIRPAGPRFDVAAEGSIAGAKLDGAPAPLADAQWSFAGRIARDGKAAIDRLAVSAADGSVEAAGSVDPAGLVDLRLSARTTAAPLVRLGAPVHGAVTLTGHVRGDLATGAIGGDLAAEMQRPEGEAALVALLGDRLRLSVTAARAVDGGVRATALRVEGAHVNVEASGGMAADGAIDAKVALALRQLDVLSRPLGTPLAGSVTVNGDIAGSIDRPAAVLRIASPNLSVGGRHWRKLALAVDGRKDGNALAGRVEGTLEADGLPVTLSTGIAHDGGQRITIDKLALTAATARLTGNAVLMAGRPVSATARIEAPDLARLAPVMGVAAAGSLSLDARLEQAGRTSRLTASGSARDLAVAGSKVRTATLKAMVDDPLSTPRGTLSLQARGVVAGGQAIDDATLEATGDLAREIRATLTARAARPQPTAVDLAATVARDGQAIAVTVARGKVTLDRQEITIAAPLRIRLEGGVVTADGIDIRLEQGRVTGNGRYAPDGVVADLAVQQLSIATLGRLAGMRGMQGRIDATARIDTRSQRPTGSLTLKAGGIRWRGTPRDLPPLAITADANWQDGRATLSAALADLPDATLSVEASLPLQLAARPLAFAVPPDGAISGRADGRAALARLRPYLPAEGLAMSGRLEAALRLEGTVAAPRPGGRATLAGGRIEDGTTGLVLADLQATIVGDGTRFQLETLAATDGAGGRIDGSGAAERGAAGWGGQANISIERFRVLASDLGRVIASGRIEARSGADGARIGGTVRIDQGDITIPQSAPAALKPLPVTEINRPGGAETGAAAEAGAPLPVRLAVDLSVPGRLFVRGRGLDSEWRGDLRITGTLDQPQLNGSIRTVRGRYELLGRRFNVERGVIEFDGAPTDARLDLLASATTNQLRATVTVSGQATQPKLELGSEPPLPQDEVLAQVLFGKSTSQITPGQALQLAQAAAELAGIGAGVGVVDRIRQAVGLDTLDIGGADGTSVTLGRYITDDVFVKVNPNPGPNEAPVGVEIKVLPNVTVDAGVGGEGSSIGLKYRFDY